MGPNYNDMDEVLRYDGLADAEEMTGASYKDSEFTEAIGMQNVMEHIQKKRAKLEQLGDSHYRMRFPAFIELVLSLGFEEIYRQEFVGEDSWNRNCDELYLVFWNKGVLLTAESYRGSINRTNFYYCWKPNPGERIFDFIENGREFDGVLCGHHDGREALRYNYQKLLAHGTFLENWVDQPFLWLVNYMEVKHPDLLKGDLCEKIRDEKVGQFKGEGWRQKLCLD